MNRRRPSSICRCRNSRRCWPARRWTTLRRSGFSPRGGDRAEERRRRPAREARFRAARAATSPAARKPRAAAKGQDHRHDRRLYRHMAGCRRQVQRDHRGLPRSRLEQNDQCYGESQFLRGRIAAMREILDMVQPSRSLQHKPTGRTDGPAIAAGFDEGVEHMSRRKTVAAPESRPKRNSGPNSRPRKKAPRRATDLQKSRRKG